MKKTLLLFVSALLLCSSNVLKAQKQQGEFVVTAGAAQSLSGILFTAIKDGINYSGDSKSTTIPNLILHGDYGLSDVFSLGLGYSYQSLQVSYRQYTDDDSVTYSGNFEDRFTRQNVGLRTLFHFGENPNLDLYAGARTSFTFWNHTTNRQNGNTVEFGKVLNNRMRFQALFGMRYYFSDLLGVNLEFSIGAPYFIMGGINLKFGPKG